MTDFLDKFAKTIASGIDAMGSKSKEFLDVQRVKSRIADLNAKRRLLCEELGKLTHAMMNGAKFDQDKLRAKSGEISAVEALIADAEAELEHVREMAREPRSHDSSTPEVQPSRPAPEEASPPCAPAAPESLVTATDSASTAEPASAAEGPTPGSPEAPLTCECGASLVEGARYCVSCGRPVYVPES
ncbi:MAG: hypothetical protein VB144_09940 [Clostridia bacterium]|nr:hypothetical protein [Clostridia bacterium]